MSVNGSIFHLIYSLMILLRIWTINAKFVRGPSLTNWADAKAFCDENYEGLATITDAIELSEAQTECFKEGFSTMGCWFGLSATINPEHSTILDWTLYDGGLPGTPATEWGWHRGLAVGNTIYLIGKTNDVWKLDLTTQLWSSDTSVTITPDVISLDGQFGAAINGEYYFMSYDSSTQIQRYVPGVILDSTFATFTSSFKGKCFTANEDASILYVINNGQFQYVNVSSASPIVTTVNPLSYNTNYPQCAYQNGHVYVFGGAGENRISCINVGINNENVGSSTWEILTTTMPASGIQYGEAVVASNGKIYIGGINAAGFRDKVYEFDPADETIIEVANLNTERAQSAFIYVESIDKICALTGDDTANTPDNRGGLDSWECSNVISLGGVCTWSWDDDTTVNYGFNEGDGTDPTTGLSPWYTDRPDGCGQGISNDFCGALGASGAACEQLFDDVDCDNTSPFPLCYAAPTTSPTTSPTDNTNNPSKSPTSDSNDDAAALYQDENIDTQTNTQSKGVVSERIIITFSRAAVLNLYAIICAFLLMIAVMAYCFCFKHTKKLKKASSTLRSDV